MKIVLAILCWILFTVHPERDKPGKSNKIERANQIKGNKFDKSHWLKC